MKNLKKLLLSVLFVGLFTSCSPINTFTLPTLQEPFTVQAEEQELDTLVELVEEEKTINTIGVDFVDDLLLDENLVVYSGEVVYHSLDIMDDLLYPDIPTIELSEITYNTFIKNCNVVFTEDIDLNGNTLLFDGFTNLIYGTTIKNGTIISLGGVNQFYTSIINCDLYSFGGDLSLGDDRGQVNQYNEYIIYRTDFVYVINNLYLESYFNGEYFENGCLSCCGMIEVEIENLYLNSTVGSIYYRSCVSTIYIENVINNESCLFILNSFGYPTPTRFENKLNENIDLCLIMNDLSIRLKENRLTYTYDHHLEENTPLLYCPNFSVSQVKQFLINNESLVPSHELTMDGNYLIYRLQKEPSDLVLC